MKYLLIVLMITVISCTGPIKPNQDLITVNSRDLTLADNKGDGEGLAKPVPGQPLLINNQLIFSMMGDAVLGIAVTVGAISQTIELFADMQALTIESWVATEIDRVSQSGSWQLLLKALHRDRQRLVIEPYAYLNGHPDAVLEVRLSVTAVADGRTLWEQTLSKQSESRPLQGAGSWSEDRGQALLAFTRSALPALIKALPQSLSEAANH